MRDEQLDKLTSDLCDKDSVSQKLVEQIKNDLKNAIQTQMHSSMEHRKELEAK